MLYSNCKICTSGRLPEYNRVCDSCIDESNFVKNKTMNKEQFIEFVKRLNCIVNNNKDCIEINGDAITITLIHNDISNYQSVYELIKEYEESYKANKKAEQFREHAQVIIDSDEFHNIYETTILHFQKLICHDIRDLIDSNKYRYFDQDQIEQLLSFIIDHFTIEWDKDYKQHLGELK